METLACGSCSHNISCSLKLPLVFLELDRYTVHVFYFLNTVRYTKRITTLKAVVQGFSMYALACCGTTWSLNIHLRWHLNPIFAPGMAIWSTDLMPRTSLSRGKGCSISKWLLYISYSNVPVKSKLQQPPGIWIFGRFLFKFPLPLAEKLFKCPHPRESYQITVLTFQTSLHATSHLLKDN